MAKRSYGWKPSPPDFRDQIFSAKTESIKALPSKVILHPFKKPLDKPFDQGNLGSCGPNSAAAALIILQLLGGKKALVPSRLQIYYHTRVIMGMVNQDSGVYNRDLLKALNKFGWTTEELWPYKISDFKKSPNAKAVADAATRKITAYQSIPQNLTQMKASIFEKKPFIFGFTVYESFEREETERTGEVIMPSSQERVLGGHDVLIVGYDDSISRFYFLNSWGSDWGNKGYGTIPYAYGLESRLSGDFWNIKETIGGEVDPDITPPSENEIKLILSSDMKAGTYTLKVG